MAIRFGPRLPARVGWMDDSSVSIGIRPWAGVADYRAAIGEINEAVLKMFRNRGIVMPFPQREVRLVGGT